ncbi:hypothetical protein UFOVP32_69 [uncultured Caudovirales phage]|uniref:Portal protein n=1 Tax=uncultured Caudovirales phage TaxID=2100421 RepID=A0A6J5KTS9_9CAUD|nr:hypothetical protein UFOVP32_69 [uncultured Caudovirales phage]CAB4123540.1 hypothetical protein UFOVP50_7 [uncultured Caudovirales phage]
MTDETNEKLVYSPDVIGSTGLRQYGGFISEEFLPELTGVKGSRTYREMADNDGTVGAVLFAITTLIRKTNWTVQAADDTPEAEAAQQFVEEVMNDMSVPWSSVITEACSMFTYGYAPMEIVWKKRLGPDKEDGSARSAYSDGKIGVRTISLRAQPTVVRWNMDPLDGSIDGFWQQPFSGPMVYIPIEKLLLFRTTDDRNNPEGRSILRTAYRAYYYKKRIEEIEAIGVERDMAGLPVAYIPSRYFAKDADVFERRIFSEWQKLVTTIRRDQREGVVMPSDRDSSGNLLFELKLLSTAGSRTFDTSKVIERYDRSIATSVLADFIFLGQQSVGSFALSSDKTALFATAVGAFTKAIEDVFNRHLLPRLWKLNGLDMEFMPQMRCGDLETQNLGELSDFISKLTSAGATMFPDRELENHLRGIAGLPLAPEDSLDMEQPDPNAEMQGDSVEQEKPDAENDVAKTIHKRLIYDETGLLVGVEETISGGKK